MITRRRGVAIRLLGALRRRTALIVSGIVLLLIGFLPLFNSPGYEYSLAAGLVLPSFVAVSSAWSALKRTALPPRVEVERALAHGVRFAALGYAIAFLHGLRSGFCDLASGSLHYALTAGMGCLLGSLAGATAGLIARGTRFRRTVAVALALALPLGSIGVSLYRFYSSPMIFAFDPFVGYFSGSLYDTVIDAGLPLWTYRAGSLATIIALLLGSPLFVYDDRKQFRFLASIKSPRPWLAVFVLGISITITLLGAKLGHWQTPQTIAQGLGGELHGARCDISFPEGTRKSNAARLLRDCEAQLAYVESRLELSPDGRVHAYFFRDAKEKRHFMGAADTLIAKPWRREVYVQLSTYPHPILGHELAHVVLGRIGRGPFSVAGGLRGLLPNPGLIEGGAVSTSPDDDEIDPETWSRAMLELGLLPPLSSIFSLSFLGHSSSMSYTVAGAFMTYVRETFGVAVMREWYAGAELPSLTNEPFATTEEKFRAALKAQPVDEKLLAYAKARFERPSVFGRKCPHVVDALLKRAGECEGRNEVTSARNAYDEALQYDPMSATIRFQRNAMELSAGNDAAQAKLLQLLDENVSRAVKDRVEEAVADAHYRGGDFANAASLYAVVAARTTDEDFARTLEVKQRGALDPSARNAVRDLLLSPEGGPPDRDVGLSALGDWAGRTNDPLARYLLARNLVQRGEFAAARPDLEEVFVNESRDSRIGRETERLLATIACAVGDIELAKKLRVEVRSRRTTLKLARCGL